MHEKRPRQVTPSADDQQLKEDIERYRLKALELGASGATIIPAEKVYVDNRVRVKCTIPKCPEWGSNAHCPPHGLETDKVRDLVSCFRYGLLVKLDIDSSITVGEGLGVWDEGGKVVMSKNLKQLLKEYRKLCDIVTEIESDAFYDGHYLAVSFAAGSCNSVYCNFKECQVLKGKPCRFPLRARPSMESSGMVAYKMAAEAGWEIFPIGGSCNPGNVPHGTLLGLALID